MRLSRPLWQYLAALLLLAIVGWVSASLFRAGAPQATQVSFAPRTENEAAAQIEAGIALNSRTVTYDFPEARVQLMKVVSLPEDELGLWFSLDSDSPRCCSFFPRIALEPTKADLPVRPVVISLSSVTDSRISMRMFDPDKGRRYSFTVDLAAMGVPAT
jgi:hypothetical protein